MIYIVFSVTWWSLNYIDNLLFAGDQFSTMIIDALKSVLDFTAVKYGLFKTSRSVCFLDRSEKNNTTTELYHYLENFWKENNKVYINEKKIDPKILKLYFQTLVRNQVLNNWHVKIYVIKWITCLTKTSIWSVNMVEWYNTTK